MRVFQHIRRMFSRVKDEDLVFFPREPIELHEPTQITETEAFKTTEKFGPEVMVYSGPAPDSDEGKHAAEQANQKNLDFLSLQIDDIERREQSRMKPGQVVTKGY